MVWTKGVSGNPHGRPPSEKAYADAVRIALADIDPVSGKRKLRRIAEIAVDMALKGDLAAIQHIADRIDGKPAQESNLNIRNEHDRTDWTWESLVAFINDSRARGNGADSEVPGEPGSDNVH
jgi:Family of unknown function (DUF5681)